MRKTGLVLVHQRVQELVLALVFALVLCGPLYVSRAQQSSSVYFVREGDTLTSIASRYGVSIEALVAANKLPNGDAIYVGQRLVIPIRNAGGGQNSAPSAPSVPDAPGTYTVQPGDTLIGIAGRYGVSVEALMAANKLTDPGLVRIGQVLKIPGQEQQAPAPGVPTLGDGQYTLTPSASGPPISVEISGGRLVSLMLNTVSSGKQSLPLSCEAKIAGQLAMMYGLTFDEASFMNRLPHSLNPRVGFVGSVNGRFYWPRDLVGGTADGPGGYGIHAEGWMPTFQALSGFQLRVLPSGSWAAEGQIDAALWRGYPVAVWAILGFRAPLAQNSLWIGPTAGGTAIDCGGPGPNCSYLVSGEHAYLILGRKGDDYLVYDPGSGAISYFPRNVVVVGITTLFATPTGSAPGVVIVPSAGHVPDLRQLPSW